MSENSICVIGQVRGKVQGVWFRRFVQQCAEPLGIAGYAENLPDGSVEVLLCGSAETVSRVQQQVAVGPPDAQVADVQWQDDSWRDESQLNISGFLVR